MKRDKKAFYADMALVMVTMAWGMSNMLMDLCLEELEPMTLNAYRFLEGWVAVALVIFCLWRPINALWGSALFGALLILYLRLPLPFLPTQIYKIVPYIATALVLIMVSMRQRREDQPPQGLGLNYFREDR